MIRTATILAIAPDAAQTTAVRQIVKGLAKVELTLVPSVDRALQILSEKAPDLILLPPLMAPAAETDLLTNLRTLPHCADVEVLMTPMLDAASAQAPALVTPRGWRPWRSRRAIPQRSRVNEARLFAERVAWSLQRARQRIRAREPIVDDMVDSASPVAPTSPAEPLTATENPAPAVAAASIDAIDTGRRAGEGIVASELHGSRAAILDQPLQSPQREQLAGLLRSLQAGREPADAFGREVFDRLNVLLAAEHPTSAGPAKEQTTVANDAAAADADDRRRYVRVDGPFDGLRLGAIETPLLVRDLSEGGCFVDSLLVEAKPGGRLSIGMLVPGEDWITTVGEVVREQPGFGFAVRFSEMSDADRASLARVIASRLPPTARDAGERLLLQSS